MKKQLNSVTPVRSASRKLQSPKHSSGPASSCSKPDVRLTLLICLLIAAATAVAYWQVLNFKFIRFCDDEIYLINNPFIARGITADALRWAFTTYRCANWHPLTWVSYMVDHSIYGLNPGAFHLTNLLFHIANALILFLLLNRMTRSTWKSGLVAALFALHPLHVESVAWVAERKDVLSTFFWLLTTYAYVHYAARPKIARYLAVVALFGLGLMSKPMLVSLPLVLLLLDYWPLDRAHLKWRLLWEKVPLFAMSGAACTVTLVAQRAGGAVAELSKLPLAMRIENAAVSYFSYIIKTLWPVRLAFFYPYPENIPAWQIAAAALMLVLITFLVFRQRSGRPYLLVGWLWYLVTLVPVIGIVQVGGQAMADRYSYVTLTGIFVLIVWGISEIIQQRKPALQRMLKPAALVVVAVLGICTWHQANTWRNTLSLSDHAVKVTRNNFVAYDIRGVTRYDRGGKQEGLDDLETAVRISPTFGYGQLHLGDRLVEAGRPAEGVEHLLSATDLGMDSVQVHKQLACAYCELGRTRLAEEECRKALEKDPECAQAFYVLGVIAVKRGRYDDAIAQWGESSRLNPGFKEVHQSLAAAYACKGDYAAAWKEVYHFIRMGGTPARDFIAALSSRMPNPGS